MSSQTTSDPRKTIPDDEARKLFFIPPELRDDARLRVDQTSFDLAELKKRCPTWEEARAVYPDCDDRRSCRRHGTKADILFYLRCRAHYQRMAETKHLWEPLGLPMRVLGSPLLAPDVTTQEQMIDMLRAHPGILRRHVRPEALQFAKACLLHPRLAAVVISDAL